MEFHVIPWWNHVKFHGGITLDGKMRRWNHAMEFHAESHGQHRARRTVHRPPWNGTEPIPNDAATMWVALDAADSIDEDGAEIADAREARVRGSRGGGVGGGGGGSGVQRC